jgi:hypothetical protein
MDDALGPLGRRGLGMLDVLDLLGRRLGHVDRAAANHRPARSERRDLQECQPYRHRLFNPRLADRAASKPRKIHL